MKINSAHAHSLIVFLLVACIALLLDSNGRLCRTLKEVAGERDRALALVNRVIAANDALAGMIYGERSAEAAPVRQHREDL